VTKISIYVATNIFTRGQTSPPHPDTRNILDPDPKVLDPDPKVLDPDPKVLDPDPKVLGSDPKVLDPNTATFCIQIRQQVFGSTTHTAFAPYCF
jgi:hypothetical protein